MNSTTGASTRTSAVRSRFRAVPYVPVLAGLSAVAVALANTNGISIGDDGVGYQAVADSLLDGLGYGYFLERPLTVWPPVWPTLMAAVAKLTPFGAVGAAIVLNCIVSALVVIVGNRLIRLVVTDEFLIVVGTAVLAIGPATVGLGHVLMTDMSFALVVLLWMVTLIEATRRDSTGYLIGAAGLAWVGFGLRYVGLTLIAVGGLWLLLQHARPLVARIKTAVLYGLVASVFPIAWMARNYSIDGTFTGERHTSARGLIGNGFDLAATIGRFLVPGVLNEQTKLWAAVGVLVTLAALLAVWALLASNVALLSRGDGVHGVDENPPIGEASASGRGSEDGHGWSGPAAVLARAWRQLGSPVGLVGLWAVLYLAYMLYVRTTTALNQLELRLLFPSYFPVVIMGLVIACRLPRLGVKVRHVRLGVGAWAAVNLIAGLVAMVAFGAGHPFFAGDYAGETFQQVRSNQALDALPKGCETYSNLPNALYPAVRPKAWSPQRTALESVDPLDDLDRIKERSADHELCLVWIREKPVYGHLWTLAQLERRLSLQLLAGDGPVSVFRIHPPTPG